MDAENHRIEVKLIMFLGKGQNAPRPPARWVAPTLGFFGVFAALAAVSELVTAEATTIWSRRDPDRVVTPHSDPGAFFMTVGLNIFWGVYLLYLARRQWRDRRDMLDQLADKPQEPGE